MESPWLPRRVHFPRRKWESVAIKPAALKGNWFASESLARQLEDKNEDAQSIQYHIAIKTSSSCLHYIIASVWISIYGTDGSLLKHFLTAGRMSLVNDGSFIRRDAYCFFPGSIEVFPMMGFDVGKIMKISLQHKVVEGGDWLIDEVRVIHSGDGQTYQFNVRNPGIDKAEESKAIQSDYKKIKEAISEKSVRDEETQVDSHKDQQKVVYEIQVFTGDVRGAGTSSNIFITIIGRDGTTPHIRLVNGLASNFNRGSTSIFRLCSTPLGCLEQIKIGIDHTGMSPSWFLDHISIHEECSQDSLKMKTFFPCGMWFDTKLGDKHLLRQIKATFDLPFKDMSNFRTYVVTTVTGKEVGGGTTAVVYATLHGSIDSSDECILDSSRCNFQPGRKDSFSVTVARDLGEIISIQIRHDDTGDSPNWSLEKMSVLDVARMQTYTFPCYQWLSSKLPNCQPCITLTQHKHAHKSTQATQAIESDIKVPDVYDDGVIAKVIDNGGFTPRPPGEKPRRRRRRRNRAPASINHSKQFSDHFRLKPGARTEKGMQQIHLTKKQKRQTTDSDGCVSEMASLTGTKNSEMSHSHVTTDEDVHATDRQSHMSVDDSHMTITNGHVTADDGHMPVNDHVTSDNGHVTVFDPTSNPNDNDLTELDMENGIESGHVVNRPTVAYTNDHLTDTMNEDHVTDDHVTTEGHVSTDDHVANDHDYVTTEGHVISDDNVTADNHDNKDAEPADAEININLYFDGNEQQSNGSNDHKDDVLDNAVINDVINDSDDNEMQEKFISASDSNDQDHVTLSSTSKSSKSHSLDRLYETTHAKSVDVVIEDEKVNIEPTTPALVVSERVDNFDSDSDSSSSSSDSELRALANGRESIGNLEQDALDEEKTYELHVFTGNILFAGTDSNIYATLYGSKGSTEECHLHSSKTHQNKFERNSVDVFDIKAADLGEIMRLKLRADGRFLGSDYFVEKVEVVDVEHARNTVFVCQQWLSKETSKGGVLEKEFVAENRMRRQLVKRATSRQGTNYKITVKTGDYRGAGTDANVFLTLFGEENSTHDLHLSQSLTNDNKFERNQTDIFMFNIPFLLGPLQSLKVWHDNKGFGASWFLESITVCDESTGNLYDFPCHGWLARDKGDGRTVRELNCANVRTEEWEDTNREETDVLLPQKLKSRGLNERWMWSMFQIASQTNDGFVTESEMFKLCRKLSISATINTIKERFKEVAGNSRKSGVDYQQFKKCLKDLVGRPEVTLLFNRYSSNREYLSIEELLHFLSTEQMMDCPAIKYCEGVIQDYGEMVDDGSRRLTLDAFAQFLLSSENSIFNPVHATVYQDMTQPLTHYFIAASHNTYLLEHQLKGQSSEEGYVRALRKGCRCVEIDCWDGEDGEPEVYHGYTLTSRISLKSVLETINKHAFDVSEYPVILSFENHCSEKGQRKIAGYLQETFGDTLYTTPVDKARGYLPSPDELRRKIIIKNKKLDENEEKQPIITGADEALSDSDEFSDNDQEPPPSPSSQSVSRSGSIGNLTRSGSLLRLMHRLSSSPGVETGSLSSAYPEIRKVKKVKQKIAVELSRLVNVVEAVKYHSLARGNFWQMSSLGESKLFKLINTMPEQVVDYNRHQMMRVYPAGRRVDSSNYNPMDPWLCGCSMVALNYQFPGKMMDMNQGLFQQNGFSGFVLKPTILRSGDYEFNPFSDDPVPYSEPKLLTIKVISGQQLPKPGGSSADKEVDPSVVVEVVGLFCDRTEERTQIIPGNGFNPLWEEKFVFSVHFPEMALIRLLVLSGKGMNNVIGQCTLPFTSLQQGYRHVPLLSAAGHSLPNATLFVQVSVTRGLIVKKSSTKSATSLSKSATIVRSRSHALFSPASKKLARGYVKLKKVGIQRLDGLFQTAEYLLMKSTDLQEDADMTLQEFQEQTGTSNCKGFAEAVSHFVVANSQYGFAIKLENKVAVLRTTEESLPLEIATLVVLFQRVVSEAQALVSHGDQLVDEIMRVHETGSKLTITVELKQSGLKDKALSKGLESFAWNMQMLKDAADILKASKTQWQLELEKLSQ